MKQAAVVLLISSSLLLPLAGCGGGGSGDSSTPSPAPAPSPSPGSTPSPSPNPASDPGAGNAATCIGSFTGSATVSFDGSGCAGCSTMNLPRAIDSDSATFASQTFTASGGTLTLRATAQSGTAFPAGRKAGAVMSFPSATVSARSTLLFKTYLGGSLQEQGGGFVNVADGTINPPGSSANQLYTFPTSKPFDAVEAVLTRQGSADTDVIKTFEFCNTQ